MSSSISKLFALVINSAAMCQRLHQMSTQFTCFAHVIPLEFHLRLHIFQTDAMTFEKTSYAMDVPPIHRQVQVSFLSPNQHAIHAHEEEEIYCLSFGFWICNFALTYHVRRARMHAQTEEMFILLNFLSARTWWTTKCRLELNGKFLSFASSYDALHRHSYDSYHCIFV